MASHQPPSNAGGGGFRNPGQTRPKMGKLGGVGGSLIETEGSRSEEPCLDFILVSNFKRNFELFVKGIPQPGKHKKL